MKVLVTGAAGFIGSTLSEALVARGDQVVGLDSFTSYYSPAIKRANLASLDAHPAFTLVEADLRRDDLAELLAGIDVVPDLLGWEPTVGVAEGLVAQAEWHRRRHVQLAERVEP